MYIARSSPKQLEPTKAKPNHAQANSGRVLQNQVVLYHLALGAWHLAIGPWFLALGPWSLALGPWPLALGPWPLALGPWPLALGPWPLALGPWPLELLIVRRSFGMDLRPQACADQHTPKWTEPATGVCEGSLGTQRAKDSMLTPTRFTVKLRPEDQGLGDMLCTI